MVAGGRVELPSLAYETKLEPPPVYPAITWFRQMESNHLMPPYRDGAHPESLAGMEPGGRLELPCQPYQSCGSSSILARRGSGDGSRTHSAALRVPYAAVNISPEQILGPPETLEVPRSALQERCFAS